MTTHPVLADRLDLLRRLTASTPNWTLVKGAPSALDGRGDIDSAAPSADWPTVRSACAAWAAATGRGPLLACDHVPGSVVLAVVEPADRLLVQVDLLDHRLVRGSRVLCAADVLPAAAVDDDGYRRLRPGAEAVVRLVLDEWRTGAPPIEASSLVELRELLQADPEGAQLASSRLDPRLREAVAAVAAGRWPRKALLAAELTCLAHGLRHPAQLLVRAVGRRSSKTCPLLGALANERTVDGDLDEWIASVDRAHPRPRL